MGDAGGEQEWHEGSPAVDGRNAQGGTGLEGGRMFCCLAGLQ